MIMCNFETITPLILVISGWCFTIWLNNTVRKKELDEKFRDSLKDFLLFIQHILKNPDSLNNALISIQIDQLRLDSKRISGNRKQIGKIIAKIELIFDSFEIQKLISTRISDNNKNSDEKVKLMMEIGTNINLIIGHI